MLCEPNRCTGCSACYNVCGLNAIKMVKTELGITIPVIDSATCARCGRCETVCPIINMGSVIPNKSLKCYAAWSEDNEIKENASSAGVVSTIGRNVICQGGIVFGARFEKRTLIFDSAQSIPELLRFQGSKYVQASVGRTFKLIAKELQLGRLVMFVGTPCQIHGLKQFLQIDYDNLLLVDLVCHGVSSIDYLNDYLMDIGIEDYDNVVFRGKRGMSIVVSQEGKVKYYRNKLMDLYYTAYLKGLINRDCCYECPYASLERYGDLTFGDFWGLEYSEDLPKLSFISLMLVNTSKGEKLLKRFGQGVKYVERSILAAVEKNGQLSHPCPEHVARHRFLMNYSKYGFTRSVKKTSLYKCFLFRSVGYRLLVFASKIKKRIVPHN